MEGMPSDIGVGTPLAAIDMATCHQGSCLLAGKLEVESPGKR